jgi:hypothetical protein
MRLARHRLRHASTLPREAAELLIDAAEHLVTPPPLETVRAEDGRSTRDSEVG